MRSAPLVAFVTCRDLPDLTTDDRLAAAALTDLGARTEAVCWDDPLIGWPRYDAIVLRSTWDYFLHISEFRAWIDRLEAMGAPLWNRPDTLRWNVDKRYLATLASTELTPPPTAFFTRGSPVDLAGFLEERSWEDAVMKPTISANAFSTERTSRASAAADQAIVDAMVARSDVMIQQLVPEIQTNGELSLMFFAGSFSHAVRKQPQSGEFRVQERLGGTIGATTPPGDLVEDARGLLETYAPGYLYARVDVVSTGDRFVLMEIELVEPSLYLEYVPAAARAFAAAVRQIA